MTDTKQYVATEGYPHNYKDNQDCNFNFEASSGREIIVLFEDFHLEAEYDFLYFRKLYMDLHKYSEFILLMQYIFPQNKEMVFSFKLWLFHFVFQHKVLGSIINLHHSDLIQILLLSDLLQMGVEYVKEF